MIVEFTVVPLDKGPHLSDHLAPVIDLVDRSGLEYRFTPMGTIVEGDWESVMELIRRCHAKMREGSERVVTTVKIDDHAGRTDRIAGKTASVEKRLGRDLRT